MMGKRSRMVALISYLAFGISLTWLSPVFAQTEEDAFMLEEITVTAQKRAENQQKVAISMDVISAEDIRETGKNDLTEILSTVTSAIIQKSADGLRVSIRGVNDYTSAGSGQAVATPTVAVNVDGVTSNRKDSGNGLYDLERVEILYGPQSTLYATQSPGGIVNVVTASPKLDTVEASGTVEYGNYDLIHTEGMLNVPINDVLAVRTAFSTSVRDGYLSNGGENEDTKSARIKGLYQPDEKLSITATAEIQRDGGSGYAGGVEAFIDESDVHDPWTGEDEGSIGSNDQTKQKIFLNLDYDLGWSALTVIPSYSKGDGSRTMVQTNAAGTEEQVQYQESEEKMFEARLNSASGASLKWIVGFIYYDALDRNENNSQDYIDDGEGEFSYMDMEEELMALYANLTYPVTDTFRLSAGIRQSWDDYYMIKDVNRQDSDTLEYSVTHTEQLMENPSRPDLNLGFEYDLAENAMLYGGYSTAYRLQGQYRNLTDPEILKSYSVGIKSRWLNNRLQVNGSAYYYDYQNFLARRMINVWLEDTDDDQEQDMDELADEPNAAGQGDGEMMGFDISASAVITEKDRVDLSVSYIHSEWTDLSFAYYYDQTLEINEETGEPEYVPLDDEDYTGKPMTLTPPWTVNLAYNHDFSLPNGGSLSAKLESRFQSSYRITWPEDEYPYNYQEAHHIENISLAYEPPEGNWSLNGYVRNVFEYAEKLMYRADSGYMSISAPRTMGLVFSVRY